MPIYSQEYTSDDDIPQQRERSNSISPTTSMADLCLYSTTQYPTGEQSEPLKEPSNEPTHYKVASIDSLAYTISAESDSTLPIQNLKHHRQVDSTDSLSLTYTNTSSEAEDEVFQKVDYLSSSERDEEEGVSNEFDLMMNRGAYLRQLRMLALADEEERRQAAASSIPHQLSNVDCEEEKKEVDSSIEEEAQEDEIQTLPNNKRLLNYNSYLSHQRYYDDLKHADIHYIDYGNIYNSKGENGGRLVVEQRKSLGKGGLCWDAAYCLAEFVIDREDEWSQSLLSNEPPEGEEERKPKIVDLGAGTGLCGLMLAKATNSHVEITEVPELEELMADNVKRNFGNDDSSSADDEMITGHDGKAKGTISSRVLRWGVEEDYVGAPYDVIVGADIVTSLYDPVALAQTLYDLSHTNTRIYISGKSRLDKPHEIFNTEMNRLFEKVEKVTEVNSKLRSPGVFVICAEGKR